MNLNQLAKELCKREALKDQVNIAQMKEIIKHLAELLIENPEIKLLLERKALTEKLNLTNLNAVKKNNEKYKTKTKTKHRAKR